MPTVRLIACRAGGMSLALLVLVVSSAWPAPSPRQVAALLRKDDVWILPQPKQVARLRGSFDLRKCRGIRLVGATTKDLPGFPALLRERSGISLRVSAGKATPGTIALDLFPSGRTAAGFDGITSADLRGLGEQGYALRIARRGICAAAAGAAGLRFAAHTLAQIANGRAVLPPEAYTRESFYEGRY